MRSRTDRDPERVAVARKRDDAVVVGPVRHLHPEDGRLQVRLVAADHSSSSEESAERTSAPSQWVIAATSPRCAPTRGPPAAGPGRRRRGTGAPRPRSGPPGSRAIRSEYVVAFSTISRTTALGAELILQHPRVRVRVLVQRRRRSRCSASGRGQVTSSSACMRASYSMPSAFIAATASPRSSLRLGVEHLAAGPRASPRSRTRRSRAKVGDSASSSFEARVARTATAAALSANWRAGRRSAGPSRYRRLLRCSTTPALAQER